jgi:death on curing protein
VRYITLGEAGNCIAELSVVWGSSGRSQPRRFGIVADSASHDVWGHRAVPIDCGQAGSAWLLAYSEPSFLDGNKRIAHAAMEVFLLLNDCEIQASVDEQERIVLQAASGEMDREAFTLWLGDHVTADC